MAAAASPPRKPISASQKGAYYKARSKKWLLARGYAIANMEEMRMIYGPPKKPGGKPELLRAVKQDQFGADLLAMNGVALVFIQVKFGRKNIAPARHEFARHPFPDFVRRVIHVWLFRARKPEIIDCSSEVYDPCAAPSRRSTPAATTAF